jgi:Transposase DDE domain group 1
MQLQKVTVWDVLVNYMKKTNKHPDESGPQTVTEFIKVHNGQETIQIGFTDQQISGHAGLSAFGSFLHWHRFGSVLQKHLPKRISPNATSSEDMGIGYITGILSGAKKLTHVGHLRADPLLPGLLGIERIGSQSAYSRFFQSFKSAPANSVCFGALWRWCVDRLRARKDGYTLDVDSTQLLHEDGHQKEGVRTGYTSRGFKRAYHPLLAVLAEAKMVAGFRLRPGNTRCDSNVIGFMQELLARLPHWLKIKLVRADSGFCYEPLLALLESFGLLYIIVGRMYEPVHSLIRKTMQWKPTEIAGTEVAEAMHQELGWSKPRRVVLVRHSQSQRPDAGGRLLVDCPGYVFQVLVTSLPVEVAPLEIWRRYNGRAGSENVIRELDECFAIPQISLKKFSATEAALSLAVLSYNLCILFQSHVGWLDRVTAATLRFLIFTTGGIISRTGGYTTIRLAVREGPHRQWWRRLLDKLTCPFLNCNAVEKLQPNLFASM